MNPIEYVAGTALHKELFRIYLYKSTPYETVDQFKENADLYGDSLKLYFRNELSEQISKVDANVNYHGSVELGFGPVPQRFVVFLDTSFSALWVPSSECTLSLQCYYKNTYSKNKSQDYAADIMNNEQQTRTIDFGETNFLKSKNQIHGKLGFDTLTVEDVQVYGQHFLEATSLSSKPFASVTADGVLGLGFPSPFLKMEPPFYTMLDRGLFTKPVFSFYIGKEGETGELTLGDWDGDYFIRNTLSYHPVEFFNSTRKTWSVKADMISMSENFCEAPCQAMVDTGTALIVVPPSSLQSIHKTIGLPYSRSASKISCDKRWSLPNLDIRIGGQYFVLSGYDYTIQINDDCVLGLMEGPQEFLWILGNVFLSKVYTVFDLGQNMIGFANLASTVSFPKLGGGPWENAGADTTQNLVILA